MKHDDSQVTYRALGYRRSQKLLSWRIMDCSNITKQRKKKMEKKERKKENGPDNKAKENIETDRKKVRKRSHIQL